MYVCMYEERGKGGEGGKRCDEKLERKKNGRRAKRGGRVDQIK